MRRTFMPQFPQEVGVLLDCCQRLAAIGVNIICAAHTEFMRRVQAPGYLMREWRLASVQGFSAIEGPGGVDAASDSGVLLTRREQQILGLVLKGKSNAQIASELGLRLSTIKNNVSRILAKYGVASRTELTVKLLGERGGR